MLILVIWIDDILAGFTRGRRKELLIPFYEKYHERFHGRGRGQRNNNKLLL